MKAIVLVYITVIIAGVIGYVMNVMTLLKATAIDVEVIVRLVGLFVAPLGAIAGYF